VLKRGIYVKAVSRENSRRIAFRVFCNRDKRNPPINLAPAEADGLLRRRKHQHIKFVTETWRPAIRDGQRRHAMIDSVADSAVNGRHIGANCPEQPRCIRIVQQGEEKMLERDIAMRALLRRRAGTP
jgi:hypothetical protein